MYYSSGYSIGSAALACFLLFGALMDEFSQFSGKPFRVVDIAVPEVLIGGLLGEDENEEEEEGNQPLPNPLLIMT